MWLGIRALVTKAVNHDLSPQGVHHLVKKVDTVLVSLDFQNKIPKPGCLQEQK